MTIRVSARQGEYPQPVTFVDREDRVYGEVLCFIHAQCGADIQVESIHTGNADTDYFSLVCKGCGATVKMHSDVFRGDVSSLGIYHERWVSGAYQFILASLANTEGKEEEVKRVTVRTIVRFLKLEPRSGDIGKIHIKEIEPAHHIFDREVANREIPINIPGYAVGYYFYDIVEASVEIDGEVVILQSDSIRYSPFYIFNEASLVTYQDLQLIPSSLAIRRQMEELGIQSVFQLNHPSIIYFVRKETDILVPRVRS